MASVKGTVKGDREIIANLRRVKQAVGGSALDDISKESLKPMKEATESNARRHRQPGSPRGGHLDEGVVIKNVDSRGPLFKVYWISFTRRAKKLAHLVEFGTAPHYQPRRGIHHPGARAFPFFRPAYESTKQEVAETMGRLTWRKLQSAITRTFTT